MAFTLTNFLVVTFWLLLFSVFYSYIGYGILLGLLVKLKGKSSQQSIDETDADLP